MKLDGMVLDLDDTLFDTTRLLVPWADRRAIAAMRGAGLDLGEDAALRRLLELRADGVVETFSALAHERGADAACVAAGETAWFAFDPPPMSLDPETDRALDELSRLAPLALLTMGDPETQRRKIERLDLARRVAVVRVIDRAAAGGKTAALASILSDRSWDARRVVVCGDRPDSDVRAANRNGCLAVLVRQKGSEFASVLPQGPDDVPWRIVRQVSELPRLLEG